MTAIYIYNHNTETISYQPINNIPKKAVKAYQKAQGYAIMGIGNRTYVQLNRGIVIHYAFYTNSSLRHRYILVKNPNLIGLLERIDKISSETLEHTPIFHLFIKLLEDHVKDQSEKLLNNETYNL